MIPPLSLALLLVSLGQLQSGARVDKARPQSSDYPAGEAYRGEPGRVRFRDTLDERYRSAIQEAIRLGPNFAARYRIVKFQTGNGPIGAVVADVKAGHVHRLPAAVVGEGIYIGDTKCLGINNDTVLSFSTESELLIVARCIGSGLLVKAVERSFFRWHKDQWIFIVRDSLRPPPPPPVF